ncbi:MAG: amino acid ABC transporter permease [Thermostichales cyanobacterium DRC_bins_46]
MDFFAPIADRIPFIIQGIPATLQFTVLSVLFGFIWGTLLALLKISAIRPLGLLADVYTSIFRGTPLIVQISLVYYASPGLTDMLGLRPIDALTAGVLVFSLNSGAWLSAALRGGILAVDKGQRDAAMSLGIPYGAMMIDIIAPQALKNILPALLNETINVLKDTAQVSVIGVLEVLRRADVVAKEKFVFFQPYLIAAFIYYVMIMTMTLIASTYERRLRRSD